MELLVALGVAAFAGLGVWAVQSAAKRQDAWREVARRRGAMFHEPSGMFGTRPYAIELTVGDVPVFLDWYAVSAGRSSMTYTRARAMFPLPVAPRFNVRRQGFFAPVGQARGTQDVILGARASFDDAFAIQCDYPDLVRAVWSEAAQASMERWLANGRADCDGHTLTLACQGHVTDPTKLEAMLELAGAIAGTDLLGIRALAALPTATVRHPRAPTWDAPAPPSAQLALPTQITVRPVMSGGLACTHVSGAVGRAHPSFDTAIESDGTPLAPLPVDALPPAAIPALRILAAGHLTVAHGTATYAFPRIETDPTSLRAAAALIATLIATFARRARS